MNKVISLALWLCLPIALDALLKCINCEFEIPGKSCLLHHKPCKLYIGESCYRKTVAYGNTPVYVEKGCLADCLPVHEVKTPWNLTEIIHCCADISFCNR